ADRRRLQRLGPGPRRRVHDRPRGEHPSVAQGAAPGTRLLRVPLRGRRRVARGPAQPGARADSAGTAQLAARGALSESRVPRELRDVLPYFTPELEAGESSPTASAPPLAVPLLGRDMVRAALLWNLAVEAARQGAQATLVTPVAAEDAPWP